MKKLAIIFAMCSFAVLTGADAYGQNALGTGNALDRNLGVGTGGINAPGAAPNFRDRNLIITGDVIGGRGFRGSVGYTAEGDFRGSLGSNELFGFRAASAISSPQLFQNSQTYQQLRFGQDLGIAEYHRAGSGAPESLPAYGPISPTEARDRLRIDQRLRASTMAMTQREINEPRVVGTTYAQDGQLLLINASTIRGITVEHPSQTIGFIGLSAFDDARVREDIANSGQQSTVGSEFQTRFEMLRGDESLNAEAGSTRVDSSVGSDHSKVLARVAERYAGQKNVDLNVSTELVASLSRDYQQLREQLSGKATTESKQAQGEDPLLPGLPRRTAQERDQLALDLQRSSEMPPSPGLPTATETEDDPTKPPASDYASILRHGEQVDQLSSPTRDRFNELLTAAEQKLRAGEYITAEQQFERALRFFPGHPLASAGMGNAQLGAGLYLSASFTFRELFTRQPEMIDVQYARELLPNQERMDAAIEWLKEHLQKESVERRNYGFLLAYIGRQTQNRDLIEQGLSAMGESDPDNRLLPLLRDVWLASASTPAEGAQTPQPAPAEEPEK